MGSNWDLYIEPISSKMFLVGGMLAWMLAGIGSGDHCTIAPPRAGR